MTRFISFGLVVSSIMIGLLFFACERKVVPTVTTADITNITATTATSGGTIIDEGSGTVVERGICWSKRITPTINDDLNIEGGGAGTFTSIINNLEPASTYYVRAYAKNEAGIGYGMAMSFKTEGEAPSATTQAASNLTVNSATLNGVVNPNYLSTTISFEYGTTTSYGNTVTANPSPLTGASSTAVSVELSGLNLGTIYHFRIKAENSLGTSLGADMSFSIPPPPSTNGLVAYYPFNGNANDQTSNGNHGNVNGAILTADRFGNSNSAYYFDGINDDISGTTNNWPFYKTPRTISIWGKLTSLPQYTNAILLTYGVAQLHSSNSVYFQLVTGQKKVLYVAYQDDISADYDYNLDQWYHLVGTFDGSVASLYINGALIASESKPNWSNLPANFHIGNLDNWTAWFNGPVDDIRIYNRVLSQEEILSLYYEAP
jgi:hypothetical protein